MKKELILVTLLVILVVVSVVQAVQLTGLNGQVVTGAVTAKPAATSSESSGGGASLPSSLQNLPTMVGGC